MNYTLFLVVVQICPFYFNLLVVNWDIPEVTYVLGLKGQGHRVNKCIFSH